MGTSTSSSGPESGIPFSDEPSLPEENPQQEEPSVNPKDIAPQGRFKKARRNLNKYVSSGDRRALKKALGNYSRKGMGGASRVARRMRMSTSVGAGLFDFLKGIRDSDDIKLRDWVNQLTTKNLSAYEIANEIIEQLISTGGSLEEESCRDSMDYALSELLSMDPDVDFLNMDNDSIWTVTELFMVNEVFNRIYLDIGQLFESDRYSPSVAVLRRKGMRDYVKSEVSAQIQELRTNTSNPTNAEMKTLLQSVIRNTFEVFEEET